MILKQFPNLAWLKSQVADQFANRKGANGHVLENQGWPTAILNVTASNIVRDNISGPLSIFSNLSGKSHVTVDRKRVALTPGMFFISNTKQVYTLEVENQKPAETFNIHFGEAFSKKAFQSIFSSPDQLIENRLDARNENFGFYNRLIPSSKEFHQTISDIRSGDNDKLLVEEKLFQLVTILLNEEKKVLKISSNLTVVKQSTREEILKRLLHATDYIYSSYHHNPDLDELSRISCLSKFHFLRLFKLAYNQTPHQLITALKIQKAKELLKGKSEIGGIARELGFDTVSSFSRLFKNESGVYPTRFREIVS
ncbi:MAG: helix-turn-helix transcriptional regulator [Cyclobacteriaceae bacterium]|nr:helix-turn-helix transcriptional regulator [Cyclobacteriaceae bacterium]